jgi:hypothetical protein
MDEIKKIFALEWEIRERIEECEEITIYTVHILLVLVYYILCSFIISTSS